MPEIFAEHEDLALRSHSAYLQADLDQIRKQMVLGVLVVVVVIAVLILAIFSDQRNVVGWVIGLSFGLAGLAVACALILRWSFRLAGIVLIIGLLVVTFVALVAIPAPGVLPFTVLILLGATASLGMI
ncbi:MAG TPA: hypothetical protein VKX96_04905, partial [Chloroflexota bacterium]|nr:hypothetical protein [Chloroflexota bacterium]